MNKVNYFAMARYVFKIVFKKTGAIKYISHLDLLRLFKRASRRAALPLVLSEGFNPRPKIKIEPALKLGLESNDLRAEVTLSEDIPLEEILIRLGRQMPEGIEIAEVGEKAKDLKQGSGNGKKYYSQRYG